MHYQEYRWNGKVEPIEQAEPGYAASRKQLLLPERKKDIAKCPEENSVQRHKGNELENVEGSVGIPDQERDLCERIRYRKAVMWKQGQR